MPRWLKYIIYEFGYVLSHFFLQFGFSLRTIGRRNMPKSGPVLVLANHSSGLDPVLVGLAVRRHLSYLARDTLFKNGFIRLLFDILDAIPIDHDGMGKSGLEAVIKALKEERAVLIFPEGTRTDDGALNSFKPGVHLLIKRTKATVVPVGVAGAFDAWPWWKPAPTPAPLFLPPLPGTIAVSVGAPIGGEQCAKTPRKELLADLFERTKAEIDKAQRLMRK